MWGHDLNRLGSRDVIGDGHVTTRLAVDGFL